MTTLSRRKRRSSWESGTSDGSRATKTPRASIDEPSPSSQHHQSLQAPKSRVHSGDLKMRINVSQSKQKKASTTKLSSSNGQQPQNSSSVGTAAKVVRKSGALAQRPSISSVSVSVSAARRYDVAGNFYGLYRALCSRNFQNVKLRSSLQEFICHSILREINFGKV